MQKKVAELISTVFFIGKIKYAPGTFGSIPAFPICYMIMYFTLNNKVVLPVEGFSFQEQQIIASFVIELLATVILFILGTYFTAVYIKDKIQKDPREVVIDEVVGQMLTIILCSFSIIMTSNTSLPKHFDPFYIDIVFLFVLPFGLFRLFDILKPWPINWLDNNIKGALGVMTDDIAAAIFASVMHYVVVLCVLNFYPLT